MTAAGMVQVTIYQVVDVIAVGHSIVSTAFVMLVTGIMTGAFVVRCALSSVFTAYREAVVMYVVFVHIVQVAIM